MRIYINVSIYIDIFIDINISIYINIFTNLWRPTTGACHFVITTGTLSRKLHGLSMGNWFTALKRNTAFAVKKTFPSFPTNVNVARARA